MLIVCLSVLLLSLGGGIVYNTVQDNRLEEKKEQMRILSSKADQYCASSLGYLELNTQICPRYTEQFHASLEGDLSAADLQNYAKKQIEEIQNLPVTEYPEVDNTFSGAEFCQDLHALTTESFAYTDYIELLQNCMSDPTYKESEQKKLVEAVEKIVKGNYVKAVYYTYGAFLEVEDSFEKKDSGKYKYNTMSIIYNFNGESLAGTYRKESLFQNSHKEEISAEEVYEDVATIDISIRDGLSVIDSIAGHAWKK